MAILADIRRLDVRGTLAGRLDTVVATDAISGDADMVEIRGQPAGGRVAVVAIIAARDVVLIFAGCRHAIMAGAAGAQHLRMVNRVGRHKRIGIVTVFAHIRCTDMRPTLAD
jgi:hypothetical protein